MHDDALFLRTIEDLSKKVNLGDQYDWLRASALVRQLLIDGHPLVDRVNHDPRLKLAFDVPDSSGAVDEHTLVFMAGDGLLGVQPRRTVDRDGFLATRLICVKGRWFTVHEIVDTVAHAVGGVHKGDPRGDSQSELAALDASLLVLGGGAATTQIRGIGHITIVGLKPVAEVVARRLGASITWTNPGALTEEQKQKLRR
jgi:hypothetical protein